jgi:hypothetical protein
MSPQEAATTVRHALPPGGLFAGHEWRISPAPFPLGAELAKEIESLGRVLLQFYRAVNRLYLNMWAELWAPRGLTYGPRPPRASRWKSTAPCRASVAARTSAQPSGARRGSGAPRTIGL